MKMKREKINLKTRKKASTSHATTKSVIHGQSSTNELFIVEISFLLSVETHSNTYEALDKYTKTSHIRMASAHTALHTRTSVLELWSALLNTHTHDKNQHKVQERAKTMAHAHQHKHIQIAKPVSHTHTYNTNNR